MRWMMVVVVAGLALFATSGVATGGNDDNAKKCQKNGWASAVDANGNPFADEGACVPYGAKGGLITRCTVWGTSGDDILGAPENTAPDVICGFAGDDQVLGVDENDVFFGGPGNDHPFAPEGWQYGVDGTFNGGDGDDNVQFLFGTFNGGEGNDGVYADWGTFNGDAGNDGAAEVHGSGIFNGGTGTDGVGFVDDNGAVYGGPGDDRVYLLLSGTYDGGDGTDTVCRNEAGPSALTSVEVIGCT